MVNREPRGPTEPPIRNSGSARDHSVRVIAILAAYNEEDIVDQAVAHLIREGIDVYFLDDGSTDGTIEAVEPFLGKGVIQIEQLRPKAGSGTESAGFSWERILRRKEALSHELDAHWFIHQDADEFRESPWPHCSLRDAIATVDELGYNAIDFELLNFMPTGRGFQRGTDVREVFRYFTPGQWFDRRQVRCWKKSSASVDLVTSGGHDVGFPDRRVFPLRFVLRHYPVRGQEHGTQKVFVDRKPRFVENELKRGWHVQYRDIVEGHNFVQDESALTAYDAEAFRLELLLRHRDAEVLGADTTPGKVLESERNLSAREVEWLRTLLGASQAESDRHRDQLRSTAQELSELRGEVVLLKRQVRDAQQHVVALLSSWSWRLTAPLRALKDLLAPRK